MRQFRFLGPIFAMGLTVGGPSGARADLLITVNKAAQELTVSVNGNEQYKWPVSTARRGYVTPNGTYRPVRLDRTWFSRKYGNSPMPYSIFFHGGYAIHGSYERREIGRPASHGCVRLDPKNAEVLFHLVKSEGSEKTQIVIQDSGLSTRSVAARASFTSYPDPRRQSRGGWSRVRLPGGVVSRLYEIEHVPQVRISPARTAGFVDPFSELFSYIESHNSN